METPDSFFQNARRAKVFVAEIAVNHSGIRVQVQYLVAVILVVQMSVNVNFIYHFLCKIGTNRHSSAGILVRGRQAYALDWGRLRQSRSK